jgi:hypothetical protein
VQAELVYTRHPPFDVRQLLLHIAQEHDILLAICKLDRLHSIFLYPLYRAIRENALFLAIQLGFDVADFAFVTAGTKLLFGGATVFILDLLCRLNLGLCNHLGSKLHHRRLPPSNLNL